MTSNNNTTNVSNLIATLINNSASSGNRNPPSISLPSNEQQRNALMNFDCTTSSDESENEDTIAPTSNNGGDRTSVLDTPNIAGTINDPSLNRSTNEVNVTSANTVNEAERMREYKLDLAGLHSDTKTKYVNLFGNRTVWKWADFEFDRNSCSILKIAEKDISKVTVKMLYELCKVFEVVGHRASQVKTKAKICYMLYKKYENVVLNIKSTLNVGKDPNTRNTGKVKPRVSPTNVNLIRLINVVCTQEVAPKILASNGSANRNSLDVGDATGLKTIFSEDVAPRYNDAEDEEVATVAHNENEHLADNDLNLKTFPICTSEQLRELWSFAKNKYANAIANFRRSGTNQPDFWYFCGNRLWLLYLYLMVQPFPQLMQSLDTDVANPSNANCFRQTEQQVLHDLTTPGTSGRGSTSKDKGGSGGSKRELVDTLQETSTILKSSFALREIQNQHRQQLLEAKEERESKMFLLQTENHAITLKQRKLSVFANTRTQWNDLKADLLAAPSTSSHGTSTSTNPSNTPAT